MFFVCPSRFLNIQVCGRGRNVAMNSDTVLMSLNKERLVVCVPLCLCAARYRHHRISNLKISQI